MTASWCVVGAFFFFGRSATTAGPEEAGGRFRFAARAKHFVTLPQLAETGSMTTFRLGSWAVTDANGERRDWTTLLHGRPALVVFIKQSCPCSVGFEPYFQGLRKHYRDRVSFIGVFDGTPAEARDYAVANRADYPIIADRNLELVRAFKVKNGGYVGLLGRDGAIESLWPGFSNSMMNELNDAVARSAGTTLQPIETQGLPAALTTGCPYELGH